VSCPNPSPNLPKFQKKRTDAKCEYNAIQSVKHRIRKHRRQKVQHSTVTSTIVISVQIMTVANKNTSKQHRSLTLNQDVNVM